MNQQKKSGWFRGVISQILNTLYAEDNSAARTIFPQLIYIRVNTFKPVHGCMHEGGLFWRHREFEPPSPPTFQYIYVYIRSLYYILI